MKRHELMFALAVETALDSPFDMAHGAVLVRSGTVLSTASNGLGTNRLSPLCPSTHAEIATLARWFGGRITQRFEKSSQVFRCPPLSDPSKSNSHLSRGRVSQPEERRPGRRGRLSYRTTSTPVSTPCLKHSKQKPKEGGMVRLWTAQEKGHTQSKAENSRWV